MKNNVPQTRRHFVGRPDPTQRDELARQVAQVQAAARSNAAAAAATAASRSSINNNNNSSSIICRNWQATGTCRLGNQCRFLHRTQQHYRPALRTLSLGSSSSSNNDTTLSKFSQKNPVVRLFNGNDDEDDDVLPRHLPDSDITAPLLPLNNTSTTQIFSSSSTSNLLLQDNVGRNPQRQFFQQPRNNNNDDDDDDDADDLLEISPAGQRGFNGSDGGDLPEHLSVSSIASTATYLPTSTRRHAHQMLELVDKSSMQPFRGLQHQDFDVFHDQSPAIFNTQPHRPNRQPAAVASSPLLQVQQQQRQQHQHRPNIASALAPINQNQLRTPPPALRALSAAAANKHQQDQLPLQLGQHRIPAAAAAAAPLGGAVGRVRRTREDWSNDGGAVTTMRIPPNDADAAPWHNEKNSCGTVGGFFVSANQIPSSSSSSFSTLQLPQQQGPPPPYLRTRNQLAPPPPSWGVPGQQHMLPR